MSDGLGLAEVIVTVPAVDVAGRGRPGCPSSRTARPRARWGPPRAKLAEWVGVLPGAIGPTVSGESGFQIGRRDAFHHPGMLRDRLSPTFLRVRGGLEGRREPVTSPAKHPRLHEGEESASEAMPRGGDDGRDDDRPVARRLDDRADDRPSGTVMGRPGLLGGFIPWPRVVNIGNCKKHLGMPRLGRWGRSADRALVLILASELVGMVGGGKRCRSGPSRPSIRKPIIPPNPFVQQCLHSHRRGLQSGSQSIRPRVSGLMGKSLCCNDLMHSIACR
jgi:hypothetical protein